MSQKQVNLAPKIYTLSQVAFLGESSADDELEARVVRRVTKHDRSILTRMVLIGSSLWRACINAVLDLDQEQSNDNNKGV